MQIHIEWLAGEPVVEHYLSAYEGFERQGGEHVQAETESGNVDHYVV